jgi:hypothetical protein
MEINERQISRATRRKMARTAKRTAKKRAKKRKMRSNRVKNPEQIKASAQKMAKDLVSKKMAGGKKYSELSIGAKEQLEKKLAKRKGLIQKITRKMLPIAKQKEKERIKRKRASKKQETGNKPSLFFENYIIDEIVDPLTIVSVVAITAGAVAITATLAKKMSDVLSKRNVDFKVGKTYELIKKKYPSIYEMIKNQRLGRGELTKLVRDIGDEIPGLKRKSFMNNVTDIIEQLMVHHNWVTTGDHSGKLDPQRFQRESVNDSEDYMTMVEIRKMWKTEYPGVKFGFKKVRGGGSEWLLVVTPTGVELERYQNIPKLGWLKSIAEGTDKDADIKSLRYMLDISQQLSSKSVFFKSRGGKKSYIKMILHKLNKLGVKV